MLCSPGLHRFCRIQIRSPLRTGIVSVLFCRVPGGIWLLMWLLAIGLCKDVAHLVYVRFKQIHRHSPPTPASPFPGLLPSESEHPLVSASGFYVKRKQVEVSLKIGCECAPSPISCLSPGFCISSLHLLQNTRFNTLFVTCRIIKKPQYYPL